MAIRVHLHPYMYSHTGNNEIIDTTGKTVGECIEQIIAMYPGLRDIIFYKDGSLQTFIEIYVNRKAVIPNDTNHKVRDGDEIHLMMIVAGG